MAKTATLKKSNPTLKALNIKTGDDAKALKDAGGKAVQHIKMIPIDKIKVFPGLQSRLEDEVGYDQGIEDITQSIIDFGFMPDQPLAVFTSVDEDLNDVIYVSDGHGRLEAARRAIAREVEIEALPCVFVPIEDNPKFDASLQRRNTTQRGLSTMSQAVHVKRALDAGKTNAEIAKLLNITPRYVLDLEALSRAPKLARDAVKNGTVKAYKVMALMRKHKDELEKVAEEVGVLTAKKLEKEQAKAAAKASGERPPAKQKKHRWSDTQQLEAGSEVEKEVVDAFGGFFDQPTWDGIFGKSRSTKRYKVLKNVTFKISIVRDADDEATEVPDEEVDDGLGEADEEVVTTKKTRSRKKAAATTEDDAPDISAIADRA